LLMLLVPVTLCRANETIKSGPVEGIFDLRDVDFDDRVVFTLNGEWEFYWNRFIQSEDFRTGAQPVYDCIGTVPAYWHSYSAGDRVYSDSGFASYRLQIILPRGYRDPLAFDVPVFDASFRLYLDGILYGGNGVAGTSSSTSDPGYKPLMITYLPVSDTMEIIIHVSNFHHRRGGFWKPMKMGSPEKLYRWDEWYRLISILTLGMLAAFSLFFFCFFILFRKDRNMLFFSIALAGIFARMISTDIYSILIVADINWSWLIRMEYISTFFALIFFMWYFQSLLPGRIGRLISILNTLCSSVCILIVLIFKVRIFAFTAVYLQYAVLVCLLYYTVLAGARMFKKDTAAITYLIGLIILTSAIINDILIANSQVSISGAYLLHFAVQIFVFLQAVLIIHKWIMAYKEIEALHQEIEYINRNLERLVAERTGEIDKQNKQIAHQNQQLQDALDVKNRVFSLISHDLKSPVTGLAQLFELFGEELTDQDRDNIVTSSRKLIRSALDLIDNLLYWGRSQTNKIQYTPEVNDLSPMIDDVFKLFEEMASQKSVNLEYRPGKNTRGFFDRVLIGIVLRNLISNAIKFNNEGGSVVVSASTHSDDTKRIKITVSDTGVGISKEKVDDFFKKQAIESTYGTANEKGIGLGLELSMDMIQINKGEMEIDSTPGKGTSVNLILPAPG